MNMENLMMAFAFALVLPSTPTALTVSSGTATKHTIALDLDAEGETHPVMKVVKLLEDMKKQLENEMQDDKEVHQKMACWCDINEKEKSKAIDDGETQTEQLKAFLGEATGKIAQYGVQRKEAKAELESDQKALSTATALRMKENKAFAKEETETITAIKACADAITVLSKHDDSSLVEIRKMATNLQAARVVQLGSVDNLQKAQLTDFLRDASGATSFLSIPGLSRAKSYGSRSGPVFGILKQMHEDFDSHLFSIRKEEEKAESDYLELRAAKEEEISTGKKSIIEFDKRLGSTGEKKAQAAKDLKSTIKQVADDTDFLAKLKKKCAEHDAEYETRVKDRLAETQAVDETISILNDEDSFKLFGKSLSFLQSSSSASEREQFTRESAASALERGAALADAPWLALMAGRVRLDSFTEVKKAIGAMVEELSKQQKDEAEHKAWCVKGFSQNAKDTDATDDKKDTLGVKKDDLAKSVDALKKSIADTKATVAELKLQMKKASENREGENADYQETITDQRMTQMVLNKAITRMKQVYAFLQSVRMHDGQAQPKDLKGYAKNSGGAKVILMIEQILKESQKSEADAIKAEQTAQQTYETFMVGSNKALTLASEKLSTQSGDLATAEEDLINTKRDQAANGKKLESLSSEKDDLHKSCDFIMSNFKKRQDARAAEMDALKEAMSILSGSK